MPDTIETYNHGVIDGAGYIQFRESIGLPIKAGAPSMSMAELQSDVRQPMSGELSTLGGSVRDGLETALEPGPINDKLAEIADVFDRFDDIREIGIPEYGETPYQSTTTGAWELMEQLASANFFETAEASLPAFTPEHVEQTTRQLLWRDSLTETLSMLGFSEREQLSLVSNVVAASEELSWWQPTDEYPPVEDIDDYDDGVVYENLPPLHRRAMEGALLWIDGLDWHLWQYKVLVTQTMLDQVVWDVRTMLAGTYILGVAARRVADETIQDEDLAAMTTVGSALAIIGQEHLAQDVAWIDDEARKPRARAGEGLIQ